MKIKIQRNKLMFGEVNIRVSFSVMIKLVVMCFCIAIEFAACSNQRSSSSNQINYKKISSSYNELKWRGGKIVFSNCMGCHGRGTNDNYQTSINLYDMYLDSMNLKQSIFNIMQDTIHNKFIGDTIHSHVIILKDSLDALACYFYISDMYNPKPE